ncbi:MAG: hypothetical protein UX48_C0048G0011 [Candidatus Azambacteria bacterium GW2011_GWB1_46_27]|uniref:HTH arsR-type domain-containing protein n=1 Tax=Candidatus Azambacteria bacterium GW2011_GWB1_46_27 TaxID=1618617 RepID=A0A0G1RTQ8_9BACT|nr:MAG: hypothetical protein UX48_C0048G0011 [Candidatus Azambacteria bacterium GW2011_GWB1_46_27]
MAKKQLQLEAKLFKGFSDQSRLAILEVILDSPKTVSEIVKVTKLSQPNTTDLRASYTLIRPCVTPS